MWDDSGYADAEAGLISVAVLAASAGGCGIGEGSGSAQGPLWILGCRDGDPLRNAGQAHGLRPEAHLLCRRADRRYRRHPAKQPPDHQHEAQRQLGGDQRHPLLRHPQLGPDRPLHSRPNRQWRPRLGHVVGDAGPGWYGGHRAPRAAVVHAARHHGRAASDSSGSLRARRGVVLAAGDAATSHRRCIHPRSLPSPEWRTTVTSPSATSAARCSSDPDRSSRTLAPDARKRIDDDFKVAYDEQLQATFQFTVEDERVAAAMRDMAVPPSTPVIGGMLSGNFDFDLSAGASRRRSRSRPSTCRTIRSASRWSRSRPAATPSGGSRAGRARGRPTTGAPRSCRWRRRASACASRIEREKGKVAWGELIAIERPGPDRVPPPCPLFGTCGGCQWQHVTIAAQHAAKRAIVERALGAPLTAVVAASPPFGYRDRAKLAVGARAGRSGSARGGRTISSTSPLPAVRPRAGARAAGAARDRARTGAGRRDRRAGGQRRRSRQRRPGRPDQRGARAAGDSIVSARRASSGCRWRESRRWGGRTSTSPSRDRRRCAFPADGFAQVGRAGNAALVAAVMEAVGAAPGVVFELYAGSGNLTRHLVRAAPRRGGLRRRSGGDRARRAQRAGGGLVAAAAGRRRRHRRARSAARGRGQGAPGGRRARAPAHRLRVVRSADAGARRAAAAGGRLRADARRSRWT